MTDEMVRFELGFRGGGSTGGLAARGRVEEARGRAQGRLGQAIVEVAGSDQRWLLRVEEISWVRRHQSSRKLGFGPH